MRLPPRSECHTSKDDRQAEWTQSTPPHPHSSFVCGARHGRSHDVSQVNRADATRRIGEDPETRTRFNACSETRKYNPVSPPVTDSLRMDGCWPGPHESQPGGNCVTFHTRERSRDDDRSPMARPTPQDVGNSRDATGTQIACSQHCSGHLPCSQHHVAGDS